MAFDGAASAAPVLQLLSLAAPLALQSLHWRGDGVPEEDGLRIPAGGTVSFHTYFGAFYEQHWRAGTSLRRVGLRLSVSGRARVLMLRQTQHAGAQPVLDQVVGPGDVHLPVPDEVRHWRQAGVLWFEVSALDEVVLTEACWTAPGAVAAPVALGVAVCTFNREDEVGALLRALDETPRLGTAVARVVVVNQGRPGLREHPAVCAVAARLGDRLRVVEQANLGGAGGFGRGLVELLDDPEVSHAVFLDDDVRLPGESLARMHAFFSLADRPCALGGHMLDSMNPAMLYEAGATIGPDWWWRPIAHMQDLRDPGVLGALLEPGPMHYNGWWLFGFSKSLALEHGMMLPCFIRGDDIEWGVRLHARGVPTLSLPGVAVWHEPFYLKLGGWQMFYETRNLLTCAALHLPWSGRQAVTVMVRHFLVHLLTYRYYSAALILRGIESWLDGPAVLERDPRPLHAALLALRERYPEPATPRTRVLHPATVGQDPHWPVLRRLLVLLRNLRPVPPDAEPRVLDVMDLNEFRAGPNDAIAVETHWDQALPTFRRDRAVFLSLAREGAHGLWRLWREAPGAAAAWRKAAPGLTGQAFWRRYLQLTPPHAEITVRAEQGACAPAAANARSG